MESIATLNHEAQYHRRDDINMMLNENKTRFRMRMMAARKQILFISVMYL